MNIQQVARLNEIIDKARELQDLFEEKHQDMKDLVKRAKTWAGSASRAEKAGQTEMGASDERITHWLDTLNRALDNVGLLELYRIEYGPRAAARLDHYPGKPLTVDEQAMAEDQDYDYSD